MFGEFYNPKTKVLKFDKPSDWLKDNVAPIDDKYLENPNIKFFVDNNPGWAAGDELCCIGKSDLSLLTTFISRTFRKLLRIR